MDKASLFEKRKTIYVRLIALITSVIIITVLAISGMTSVIYNRNIMENAETYNRSLLNRQQKLIDKEMGNIVRIALGIVMAQSYMYSFNTIRSDLTIKSLIDLTYYLQEQKNINEYIESIYIYYDEPRRVITTYDAKRTSIVDSYFDSNWLNYLTFDNTSDSMWIVGRVKGGLDETIKEPGQENKFITYIKEMPLFGKTNGAIIINIKQSKFFHDFLSNYTDKMGQMFIMDEHGSIIYSESEELSETLTAEGLSQFEKSSTSYKDFNGEKSIVTCLTSNVSEWKFINVIPRSSLIHGTTIIKQIILLICLFYAGIALMMSTLISSRIYKPLNTLIQYLKSLEHSRNQKLPADEASLIRSAFDKIKQNNQQLLMEKNKAEKILQDNSMLMKEKYLNDLVRGRMFNPISISQYLDVFNVRVNMDNYAVIILMIENLHDILARYNKIEFNLLKYSLMQQISSLIDGDLFLKDEDKIVLLQNAAGMNQNLMMDLAKKMQKEICSRTNLTITMGISARYSGMENMENAYRDAEKALNQRLYLGKGEILTNNAITGDYGQVQFYYPYDLEKKLLHAINQGKEDEAHIAVHSIYKEVGLRKLSMTNINQVFFQLSGEIMRTVAGLGENPEDVLGKDFNILESMSHSHTLIEMEEFLAQLCSAIISYFDEKRSRINIDVVNLAVKFIEQNYNKNISIDSVAEHVSLSTSYLSRIFKETIGKTLNEYIIDVKLDKTIELLTETNYSVESICHMVGYTNISYFNKIFKTRTGTTPGRYRKQHLLLSES